MASLRSHMFLRATKRKKDGKEHRYWSVVENLRSSSGSVYQKTLLYLGDLNDSQHAAWTKALEVFNVDSGQTETCSLFPADRTPPPSDTPALSLHLSDIIERRGVLRTKDDGRRAQVQALQSAAGV